MLGVDSGLDIVAAALQIAWISPCLFTPLSSTYSTFSAISYLATHSGSSGTKRSGHGEPPPRRESDLAFPIFARPNSVLVTRPAAIEHLNCRNALTRKTH